MDVLGRSIATPLHGNVGVGMGDFVGLWLGGRCGVAEALPHAFHSEYSETVSKT
jgi:hypothetical protein